MFVVTGTGHSGTAWAARLFTELGFPCGHERWHNLSPYAGMGGADSSWMAMPRLGQIPEGTPVVHLVREPLAVLRSALRTRTGDPEWVRPYDEFVAHHRPDIAEPVDPLDRWIRHVARWDAPADAYPHRVRLRVEDAGDPARVADVVEFATGQRPNESAVACVVARLGTRVNTHAPSHYGRDREVAWERVLSRADGWELAAASDKYGYPTG